MSWGGGTSVARAGCDLLEVVSRSIPGCYVPDAPSIGGVSHVGIRPGRRLGKAAGRRGQAGFATFAVGVGLLAGLYHGVPTADVDLNDGGVWVASAQDRAIAHLNYPSMTLDALVVATAPSFDLLQSGDTVLLQDLQQEVATPVDTAAMALGNGADLAGLDLVVGGSTAVVSDPTRGEVWVLPADAVSSFSPEAPPQLTKAKDVRTTVGRDGTAFAVDPDGDVVSWSSEDGSYLQQDVGSIDGLKSGEFEVTAVGTTPVVLDRAGRQLRTVEESIALPKAGSYVLQPAGDDADAVAVATERELLLAPLSGGEVEDAEGSPSTSGTPAAPVRVGGCWYAAWGGSGRYLRDCDDNDQDMAGTEGRLKGVSDRDALVFRVNRDVVVLNDVVNGDTFLINEDMTLVANWDELLGQMQDQNRKQDKKDDVETRVQPNRSGKNHPPTARDDEYGVRPGRTTALPVLDNDSDPDGDVLLAATSAKPKIGDVRTVRGGEELQVVVPADQTRGSASVGYEAHDGRGKPGRATVTITIHPFSQNEAPEPKSGKDVVVGLGNQAEVKYNLLQDWIDPDGDPIYLKEAKGVKGIAASSTEDGTVTLRDLGQAKPGRYQIPVVVSDGQEDGKGFLDVDLRDKGNVPPIANADHATVLTGESVVISPLVNDTDANGDELRLSNVTVPDSGLTAKPDFANSTFTASGKRPGTYYVEYMVTDGPSTATGLVRVEVIDQPTESLPPSPDNDLALLRPGEATLVDVLANDYDPSGGVLVIQRAQAEPGARLTLDIVNHEFVRVRAQVRCAGQPSSPTRSRTGWPPQRPRSPSSRCHRSAASSRRSRRMTRRQCARGTS